MATRIAGDVGPSDFKLAVSGMAVVITAPVFSCGMPSLLAEDCPVEWNLHLRG